MAKIRIMLADDHTLFRQGIRTLISAEADMEVVGEAPNGGDAVEKANEVRPDVVLMDIGMPGLDAIDATCQNTNNLQRTLVINLSAYADDESVLAAITAGASPYLTQDSGGEQTRRAVDTWMAWN